MVLINNCYELNSKDFKPRFVGHILIHISQNKDSSEVEIGVPYESGINTAYYEPISDFSITDRGVIIKKFPKNVEIANIDELEREINSLLNPFIVEGKLPENVIDRLAGVYEYPSDVTGVYESTANGFGVVKNKGLDGIIANIINSKNKVISYSISNQNRVLRRMFPLPGDIPLIAVYENTNSFTCGILFNKNEFEMGYSLLRRENIALEIKDCLTFPFVIERSIPLEGVMKYYKQFDVEEINCKLLVDEQESLNKIGYLYLQLNGYLNKFLSLLH